MAVATKPWWESELAGCVFADARLGQRLRKLIERMGGAIEASLPLACQDWANTKAAYRFFSNDRVSEMRFWPAISAQPATASPLSAAPSWCFRTPRSSHISVNVPRRSASPTA